MSILPNHTKTSPPFLVPPSSNLVPRPLNLAPRPSSLAPKLTVAIPTYNRAHYLPEAIESVLAQAFQDFELLILDNASTDNTPEVVKSFKDERIRYVRHKTNVGAIGNCNKALELAQGEYVIIFHDDDVMKPELLETEVKILDEREDVVLVGTNIELIDEKGQQIKERKLPITKDIIFKQYEYIERFFKDNISFNFPTVMLRLSFLKEHQLSFRKEVGPNADSYLWHKMNLSEKELYLIARPLLNYRIHQDQGSSEKYGRNILGTRYDYKLISENRHLKHILPYLKDRSTHGLLSVLSSNVVYGKIDKTTFRQELSTLKKESFWTDDIKVATKIKIFLAYHAPFIARYMHKVKMLLVGQKYH